MTVEITEIERNMMVVTFQQFLIQAETQKEVYKRHGDLVLSEVSENFEAFARKILEKLQPT